MAFADLTGQENAVSLLQRSLERNRLGHAYLFVGPDIQCLEAAAGNLAKTLNCLDAEQKAPDGKPIDACDRCLSCRKIDEANHPDVLWVRPESKSRVITIDQVRELIQTVNLKPTEATWKVAVMVAADRLNEQAANAFLKTLEEPPGASILILLSTDPERLLETILSRCLRLNFAAPSGPVHEAALREWLRDFSATAASNQRTLLGRYQLLAVILNRLNEMKESIAERLTRQSPLERYEDIDSRLKDKWEDELTAAIEAEYRHQRSQMLAELQWWFRDVCLATLSLEEDLYAFPGLAEDLRLVAGRLTSRDAMANLGQLEKTQRLLNTNVQEALALEVALLQLKL